MDKTDSLLFDVDRNDETSEGSELTVLAELGNLQNVIDFVDANLEKLGCKPATMMQIDIIVEEVYTNIAKYAYIEEKGNATILFNVSDNPTAAVISFIDQGMPYNPLAQEDPDITLSAEEREIGGLGVFMTKKMMDDVWYEYKDGSNILHIKKNL